MKRVQANNGRTYNVDFFETIQDGKTGYYVFSNMWDYTYHKTRVYYRPEKTLDDHMGNTPCGYYVIAPLPTGEKKRVYIF